MTTNIDDDHMASSIDVMYKAALNHRNATKSPLLRLPAEIRNQIFKYVLGGHRAHLYTKNLKRYSVVRSIATSGLDGSVSRQAPKHLHLVTTICRQIYVEMRLLLISLSEFSFSLLTNVPLAHLEGFSREQSDCIRIVRLSVEALILKEPGSPLTVIIDDLDEVWEESLPVLQYCRGIKRIILEWRGFCDHAMHEVNQWQQDLQKTVDQKIQDQLPGVQARVVRARQRSSSRKHLSTVG